MFRILSLFSLSLALSSLAGDPAPAIPLKNTFRHPVAGITFNYPENWQTNLTEEVVVLIPPDMLIQNGVPMEAILATGRESGGAQSINSPEIAQAINTDIVGAMPGVRLIGKPEALKAGARDGLSFTWDGNGPTGPVRVRVCAVLLKQYLVCLGVIATPERAKLREPVLRAMFATLTIDEPKPGQALAGGGQELVGQWKNWEYKAVGNSSWEKTRFSVMRADGTFLVTENAESAHSFNFRNSGGEQTGWAVAGGQGDGSLSGRWTAANGRLTLTFSTGEQANYQYQIRPNSSGHPILYLREDGSTKTSEWTRVN